MAEFELSIAYKTVPARVGLTVMTVLMPLWALIIPFCFGIFLCKIMEHPESANPLGVAMVLLSLFLMPIVSVVLTALFEDDRILISKEGLAFPLFLLPKLGFRRQREWADLAAAEIFSSPEVGERLGLFFGSGGRATMQVQGIAKEDLEQLLLAIEVWGSHCRREALLVDFQNRLQNENKGLAHLSYTQMWEEELSRRFNATAFVPLEPGKPLQSGTLKVVRQLAFGGLSAIYLAQRNEREMVVLKEAVVPANADQAAMEKATELFNREAEFLIKLHHPQIARVLDHFQEDGRNYLLLEYIHGQDLRQLVKQHGPQPEPKVLGWALQVCKIIEYLHGQSPPIVHRDLTPDNMVLGDDEKVTVIDFGAANEFVGTATGTLVGKQSYISPEQFRCKPTTQSDIYALGATMFFLLTGKDPEPLSCSHPRQANPEISCETDELVAGLTAMETADRLASAQAVSRRIEELLAGSAPVPAALVQ